jgi:hypothetical protein
MSSDKIPGVPEGWEVDHVNRIGEVGEHCIDGLGFPCLLKTRTLYRVCIIRKIEKPAAYRHFANAEEYLPHWGKPVRLRDGTGFDSVVSTSDLGVYVASGTKTVWYSMGEAFAKLTFADGTPFGVRIDE